MVAASIRYNNPGAMWGSAVAKKWGANAPAVVLNDGLKQGNNIAVFPTKVQGACAQFDLWRGSYCGLTLEGAVKKWSGGNSSPAYISWLMKASGLDQTTEITAQLLASPAGLKLIKAQAQWEAGQAYPLSDSDWAQAQGAVFRGVKPQLPMTTKQKKAVAVILPSTVVVGSAVKAASSGHSLWIVLAIVALGVAGAVIGYLYFHHKG